MRMRCARRAVPSGGEPADALAQHIVENGYLNGEVIR
jgi:hypothetical protein